MYWIVFNTKTGELGTKRLATKAEEKDFSCNYIVVKLNPVTLEETKEKVSLTNDWRTLRNTDDRVKFVKMFDVIEEADWYHEICSRDDDATVEEAYIENKHAVFQQVLKIFSGR